MTKIINDREQKDLQAKFEMIEKEIGPDTHTKHERLAEEMDERYRQGYGQGVASTFALQ